MSKEKQREKDEPESEIDKNRQKGVHYEMNNEQNKAKSETDKLRDANKYSYIRRLRKRARHRMQYMQKEIQRVRNE